MYMYSHMLYAYTLNHQNKKEGLTSYVAPARIDRSVRNTDSTPSLLPPSICCLALASEDPKRLSQNVNC